MLNLPRSLRLKPALSPFALLAVVLLASFAAPSREASSYELLNAVWAQMPATYCINTASIPVSESGRPVISKDAFISLVNASFQRWVDLPDSNITFTYTGTCDNDPTSTKRDEVNVVGWAPLPITTGALTRIFPSRMKTQRDGTVRELLEADIIINTKSYSMQTDPVQYVATTLQHVITHEVGHFIGIDHSKIGCSVMWPNGYREAFCEDDWDAAAALYP